MTEKKQPKKNDRVRTPAGEGTVAYTRNGPPTYSEVEALSVVLDDRRTRPGYAGSMFLVDDVEVIAEYPEPGTEVFVETKWPDGETRPMRGKLITVMANEAYVETTVGCVVGDAETLEEVGDASAD